MTLTIRCFVAAMILLGAALFGPPAQGIPLSAPLQEEPAAPALQTMDRGKLEARVKEIEASTEIEEGLKAKLLEAYRLALTRLDLAQSHAVAAEEYKLSIETASREVGRIREELERTAAEPQAEIDAGFPPGAATKDLEPLFSAAQAEMTELRNALTALEEKIKLQQARPTAARNELADVKQKLEEIEKNLKAAPPPDQNPMLTEALKTSYEARKTARTIRSTNAAAPRPNRPRRRPSTPAARPPASIRPCAL